MLQFAVALSDAETVPLARGVDSKVGAVPARTSATVG